MVRTACVETFTSAPLPCHPSNRNPPAFIHTMVQTCALTVSLKCCIRSPPDKTLSLIALINRSPRSCSSRTRCVPVDPVAPITGIVTTGASILRMGPQGPLHLTNQGHETVTKVTKQLFARCNVDLQYNKGVQKASPRFTSRLNLGIRPS